METLHDDDRIGVQLQLMPPEPQPPEVPEVFRGISPQQALQQAYHSLDQVVEPELVECWVYQINAIQARCNYLIRAIKLRCGIAPAAKGAEEVTWT